MPDNKYEYSPVAIKKAVLDYLKEAAGSNIKNYQDGLTIDEKSDIAIGLTEALRPYFGNEKDYCIKWVLNRIDPTTEQFKKWGQENYKYVEAIHGAIGDFCEFEKNGYSQKTKFTVDYLDPKVHGWFDDALHSIARSNGSHTPMGASLAGNTIGLVEREVNQETINFIRGARSYADWEHEKNFFIKYFENKGISEITPNVIINATLDVYSEKKMPNNYKSKAIQSDISLADYISRRTELEGTNSKVGLLGCKYQGDFLDPLYSAIYEKYGQAGIDQYNKSQAWIEETAKKNSGYKLIDAKDISSNPNLMKKDSKGNYIVSSENFQKHIPFEFSEIEGLKEVFVSSDNSYNKGPAKDKVLSPAIEV